MTSEAHQSSLDDLFHTYDPEPSQRFYAAMAERPWRPAAPRPLMRRRVLRRWAIGSAIAIALVVSAPPVRATVAEWLGLGVAASDSMPLDVSEIFVAPPHLDQIGAISARVGWPVRTLALPPAGYRLESVVEDSSAEMVIVTYLASRQLDATSGLTATSALTLIEARHNTRIPLQVAPSTVVESVALGGRSGAYAVGAWDSEYDAQTDGFIARWRSDLAVANLFWERDGLFFLLTTDDPAVSKADLVAAAESLW